MINAFNKYIKSENLIKIFIILICIFAIFPFIYIIQFNIPGASDDLMHGFLNRDKTYFAGVWDWYYNDGHNGRYANALIMQMPNRIFLKPMFGQIFPFFTFGFLFLSIYYLLKQVIKTKLSKIDLSLLSLLLLFFFVGYSPDIHQFYWFSGTSVYVIPAILFFVFSALIIPNFNKKLSILQLILIILLLFLIIGSHENWMIISLITVVILYANSIFKKEKINISSHLILCFTIIFSLFVLLAPGTSQRVVLEGQDFNNADMLSSLIYSTFSAINFLEKLFLNIVFLITTIGLMAYYSKNINNEKKQFKSIRIIALILLIFIVIYSGFFILIYSLGYSDELRLRGILPNFFSVSLLMILLLYKIFTIPVIQHNLMKINKKYLLLIVLLSVVFGVVKSDNVKNAYDDILSGNAKQYKEECLWVFEHIEKSDEKILLIPQINNSVKTLFCFYIPENSNSWFHWVVSTYFNKNISVNHDISLQDYIDYIENMTTDNVDDYNDLKNEYINSNNLYSTTYEFDFDDIYNSNNKLIVVRAKLKPLPTLHSGFLVFQANNDWQGIDITKIIDENYYIYYEHSVEQIIEKEYNEYDKLKVYFYNTNINSIKIEKMNCYLK